ncbi:hypothetical protein NDU88_010457 [Pleurodeles waltl]|uniref:Ig-like domain-containing protein n=1 Tax=Pleurodeles waltl TaxID=8319 RepID=A0AAV7PV86_PLEWA|nr:hypothetical protein NDU88_010457 [Pleurodeles waltl]
MPLLKCLELILRSCFVSPFSVHLLGGDRLIEAHRPGPEGLLRGDSLHLQQPLAAHGTRRAPHHMYHTKPTSLIYSGKPSDPVRADYRGRSRFVGDLKSGNCSLQISSVRGDDAKDYYPWIVPLSKDYELYKVTASDRPEEISLDVPGLMTEGTPVKITCSVVHTCPSSPPSLSWDWKDSNVRNYHEDLSNGRWNVVSEINYTPMAQDHGKGLQCTATYTEKITPKRNITMAIKCE